MCNFGFEFTSTSMKLLGSVFFKNSFKFIFFFFLISHNFLDQLAMRAPQPSLLVYLSLNLQLITNEICIGHIMLGNEKRNRNIVIGQYVVRGIEIDQLDINQPIQIGNSIFFHKFLVLKK